ncbi:hypothetical protein ACLOJK_005487 [Asimina triloba]
MAPSVFEAEHKQAAGEEVEEVVTTTDSATAVRREDGGRKGEEYKRADACYRDPILERSLERQFVACNCLVV